MNNNIKIGDKVQWISQGADQWEEKRMVIAIESGFAFVEGSLTGIPVKDLDKTPTKEEYKKILSHVDWYYQRADDPKAYKKGKESYINAELLAGEDKDLQKMFYSIARTKF